VRRPSVDGRDIEVIAYERPTPQLFVVATREATGLRMRLAPVRDPGERVAALNRNLGIVPLESLSAGDLGALPEVYHVFRRLDLPGGSGGDGAAELAAAFAAWQEALAPARIHLRCERPALCAVPLPPSDWHGELRGISARPWDVELTALAAGLRSIVKLDRVPPAMIETLRQTASQRRLAAEVVTPRARAGEAAERGDSVTVLMAREGSSLVKACELEASLLAHGTTSESSDASARMGALLGYPGCCVERFARIAEQNDTTLAWALLPGAPHPPASPLTQWLQPGLALLSHAPCDLHCAASIALGERLLDTLEATEPGFAARWRSVTARVQVVDHRSNRLALAAEGALDTGATITAADVLSASGTDPDATSRAHLLVGQRVRTDAGGLVVSDGSWHAAYVADHRG
jgi:hypothetical protein